MGRTKHYTSSKTYFIEQDMFDRKGVTNEDRTKIAEELCAQLTEDGEWTGPCIEIEFSGTGYYTPATMYRSNGDPGDPEEGENEAKIDSIYFNYPTHYKEGKYLSEKEFDELFPCCAALLETIAENAVDEMDFEEPEPDYPEYDERF